MQKKKHSPLLGSLNDCFFVQKKLPLLLKPEHEINGSDPTEKDFLFVSRATHIKIVIVSGSNLNVWGHVLISFQTSQQNQYFHVEKAFYAPAHPCPEEDYRIRTFNEFGFQKYLKANKKIIWNQTIVDLPEKKGALSYLRIKSQMQWRYDFHFHNCTSFITELGAKSGIKIDFIGRAPRCLIASKTPQGKVYLNPVIQLQGIKRLQSGSTCLIPVNRQHVVIAP
jgi:hypothetical protein